MVTLHVTVKTKKKIDKLYLDYQLSHVNRQLSDVFAGYKHEQQQLIVIK